LEPPGRVREGPSAFFPSLGFLGMGQVIALVSIGDLVKMHIAEVEMEAAATRGDAG